VKEINRLKVENRGVDRRIILTLILERRKLDVSDAEEGQVNTAINFVSRILWLDENLLAF
jgi:hypothetical protein